MLTHIGGVWRIIVPKGTLFKEKLPWRYVALYNSFLFISILLALDTYALNLSYQRIY